MIKKEKSLFNFCFILRGVVTVTMDLLQLDINQCPDEYYVPNAFKGTHKCDQKTSYVSFIYIYNFFFFF